MLTKSVLFKITLQDTQLVAFFLCNLFVFSCACFFSPLNLILQLIPVCSAGPFSHPHKHTQMLSVIPAFSAFSSCFEINPACGSVCYKSLAVSLLSVCLCTLVSTQCRLYFKAFWEALITIKLLKQYWISALAMWTRLLQPYVATVQGASFH